MHVALDEATAQLVREQTSRRDPRERIGCMLVLEPEWNEVELLKLMPGVSYKGREKRWTISATWASLVMLRGYFGQHLTYTEDVSTWAWAVHSTRIEPTLAARELLTFDALTPYEERLYPYQRAGVAFMRLSGNGLLGDDLGVGKTVQMLALMNAIQHESGNALPAIVVCPNSVKYHWRNRAREWLECATPYVIDRGTARGRKTLAAARLDPTALVIVNYESVKLFSRLAPYGSVKLKRCRDCDPKYGDDIRSSQCHIHPKELNGFGFKFGVIDEAQHIGDPKSQQTRAVWATVHDPSVVHRWAMTGTPDNLERLWSIMHAVAPDEYGARSKWLQRYALYAWNAFGGSSIVGTRPDTRDELYKILDPRFRRMIMEVVLPQLPPKVREVRFAELTPTMRRMYDELDKQLFTRMPDGELYIAQNQLVAKGRLMQFAAGTIEVEKIDPDDIATWKVHITEPAPKLDVMEEVLDELAPNTAFTVGVYHRDVAFMVAERLAKRGIRHSMIMGGVHPADQTQATEDLKSGAIQAVVFTISAGAEGIDLSGSGVMILLQRSWALIQDIQTEGRQLRPGAERHRVIRIIDIVTRDTREEYQIERLHQKLSMLEEITRDRQRIHAQLASIANPAADQEIVLKLATQLQELQTRQDQLLTEGERFLAELEDELKEEPSD